ncbi:hypothetical protein JYU34_018886 [Plutella xylostella]|uniref:Uncharacterized protein n=1 Tax=Plutella xylostella TaxID=51655 RepID=A0ABQ7PYT4_PLUXY|nr:uncharacterized protein LOC105384259 [Plutella xylostella]KAG7298117.1 hypothetical protein JYU34_018886 [Plutella xylostella]
MKATFAIFILALAGASAQIGLLKTALRLKWGLPLVDSEYFIDIPREELMIISEGWRLVQRPSSFPMPALKMYCMRDDYSVCTLYDPDTGFVSGLQISLPVQKFTETPIALDTIGFSKWTAPDNVEYWANMQFFISPETYKKSPSERMALARADEATLKEGGVWVPDLEGQLMKIEGTEQGIQNSIFTKQACIVSMGDHYYYDMKPSIDCSRLFPWFGLINAGNLEATGFMVFGKLPAVASGKRTWFEHPARAAVQAIVPSAPQCLYELADNPGVYTLHIYYGKHPYTITC